MAESRRRPNLHHAVLAIAPERLARTAQLFADLGFDFDEFDLDDVGLHVMLDWVHGLELVTPSVPHSDNPVRQFLERHGDGVYTLALRVDDAPVAEQIARRYGATTNFRQHRDGDGWQLDEIEMTVLGLPVTLLSTDLP
jgi:4-hydroxyphenylpyruvate dioxygenase-like putative hemolysin